MRHQSKFKIFLCRKIDRENKCVLLLLPSSSYLPTNRDASTKCLNEDERCGCQPNQHVFYEARSTQFPTFPPTLCSTIVLLIKTMQCHLTLQHGNAYPIRPIRIQRLYVIYLNQTALVYVWINQNWCRL